MTTHTVTPNPAATYDERVVLDGLTVLQAAKNCDMTAEAQVAETADPAALVDFEPTQLATVHRGSDVSVALDPAARAAAVVAAAVVNDNVVEIAAPEPESAVADAAPLPGETDVPSEDTVDEVIEATAEDALDDAIVEEPADDEAAEPAADDAGDAPADEPPAAEASGDPAPDPDDAADGNGADALESGYEDDMFHSGGHSGWHDHWGDHPGHGHGRDDDGFDFGEVIRGWVLDVERGSARRGGVRQVILDSEEHPGGHAEAHNHDAFEDMSLLTW